MSKIVLIDGYSGSGKTSICKYFKSIGFEIFDLDYITQPWIISINKNKVEPTSLTFKKMVQDIIDRQIKYNENIVFCGISSFHIVYKNKGVFVKDQWFDIFFPKRTKIYWLNVSKQKSLQQLEKRLNEKLSRWEKKNIMIEYKLQRSHFKEIYPKAIIKTSRLIIREFTSQKF